ncbi:MAG: C-type lectin domain-containing protein [Kofleriaceae bacterium]
MEPDAGTVTDGAPTDSSLPIDADPFDAIRTQCMAAGYTSNAATGSYYRIVTANASWNAAYADCNDDVVGATHLMTMSNAAEVTFLMSHNDHWVGWIDRPTEGAWHILTDEETVIDQLTYWGNNRPDGGNSENCAVFRNNVDGKAGYDDTDCPVARDYVCECDGRPVTKPPS